MLGKFRQSEAVEFGDTEKNGDEFHPPLQKSNTSFFNLKFNQKRIIIPEIRRCEGAAYCDSHQQHKL